MRSWNCPWMSPQTITGARTRTTLGSSERIYFAYVKKDELFGKESLIRFRVGDCKFLTTQFVCQDQHGRFDSSYFINN